MGNWKPNRVIEKGGKTVYFWTVPPKGQAYPKT
jgi:hypothetical protein